MPKSNKEGFDLGLKKLSNRALEDDELRDPPARLFRKLLRLCKVNPAKWAILVNDHLRWSINDTDAEAAKIKRINSLGNIKRAFFDTPTLTFQRLLEGLSILKMRECEFIIRATDHKGEVHEIKETIRIVSSKDQAEEDPDA